MHNVERALKLGQCRAHGAVYCRRAKAAAHYHKHGLFPVKAKEVKAALLIALVKLRPYGSAGMHAFFTGEFERIFKRYADFVRKAGVYFVRKAGGIVAFVRNHRHAALACCNNHRHAHVSAL